MSGPNRLRIFELADELYEMAPWRWMDETHVIGLRHPETGELAWLSVMGALGSHKSLAVYLGDDSMLRYNLIHRAEEQGISLSTSDSMMLILESRQVQASFGSRDELFSVERAEIKKLGRKYRGENWPMFRGYRPGWAPRPPDQEESLWLELALEQILIVAPTLKADLTKHARLRDGRREVMTRERADGVWRTTWTPENEDLFVFPTPAPTELMAEKVRRHDARLEMECSFEIMPNGIGRPGVDAVYPYLLICVEPRSGLVLGVEMASVSDQTHEEMIASVPQHFLRLCDQHKVCPRAIFVDSATSHALLESTAEALGAKLIRRRELPATDRVRNSMMSFLQR